MDFSKLTLGSKIVVGAGVLLFVVSFFDWWSVSVFSANMWHGWGVLVGLTLLAILAWEGAQLTDRTIVVGSLSPTMVTTLLSALLVIFTLIKVLSESYRTSWAWVGLVLSIGVGVGAWLNMQEAGESLADLKSSAAPAGSGAPPAAPGPVPPVAPETPVATETEPGPADPTT